jgi:anthranilate synthase component I
MYPSFAQFSRWATQHRAVPIWIEPQLPDVDLLELVHSLQAHVPNSFFLQSASEGPQARYSYLALDTPRYRLESSGGSLTIQYHADNGARLDAVKIGNPIERFQQWFRHFDGPRVDGLPPFWGGMVGYFSYESARHLDPKIGQVLGARSRPKTSVCAADEFPEFEFSLFDAIAVVDHARRRMWLVHTVLLSEGKTLSPVQLEKMYRAAQDRLRRYAVLVQKAIHYKAPWGIFNASDVKSNQSSAAYQLMVRRAKGHIAAGDVYQCNLSQNFTASWEGDPWSLYRQLSAINPSPYAALWRSGPRWMVSASPELLVRQEANRVETRPIAGTYPRPPHGAVDPAILKALTQDAKERAEHIMLVDLERNDLSRVCVSPTVQVAEALTVEAYSHVLHLVSGPEKTGAMCCRPVSPGERLQDVPNCAAWS